MRIKAYSAENFKGIKSIAIEPGEHVVLIVGKNGAGKSSVLDSIVATLGGASASPEMPIRKGEGKALCTVDLGDIIVSKRWTVGGKPALFVENKDGSRPRSPQTLLNSLVGAVAFDPMEFVRKPPKEQAEALRKLAGLNEKFAAIDCRIAESKQERSQLNAAIKADENVLGRYPDTDFAEIPDEVPSVMELMEEYKQAVQEVNENRELRSNAETELAAIQKAEQYRMQIEAKLDRLKEEVEVCREEWMRSVASEHVVRESHRQSLEMIADLTDPDIESIEKRIAEHKMVEDKIAKKKERDAIASRIASTRERSLDITSAITKFEAEKEDLMLMARLPVPGLDCRGDYVAFEGVPLQQINKAKQASVGLAIKSALNPNLRVGFIWDGSLLDDDTLESISNWAVENDFQVWIEMVGSSSENGFYIEDGRVS